MNNNEIVYAVTMGDIFSALANRLGKDEALKLTEYELNLAKDEVKAALEHQADFRDFVDIGLDAWQVIRKL